MRCCHRVFFGLMVLAGPLQAQPTVMRVVLGGGSATDLRGVHAGAYVIAPSAVLFPSEQVRVTLNARGTRFVSREWAIAGGAAADARLPLSRGTTVLFGASADLTRASYRATYLQVEALPALELRLGPATVWAGARAVGARTATGGGSPVSLPGASDGSVAQRTSLGLAFGASIPVIRLAPAEELRVSYREEHGRPGGISVVDRVAAAMLNTGRLALSGMIGARRAPGEDRVYGGARLAIAVSRGVALFGGAESYPSNPLFDSPGGRSINAGLSLSTGGGRTRGAAQTRRDIGPRPEGVSALPPGLIRLSIRAPDAVRVEVAGDWNQWRPVALARAANDVWYADLAIPPGEYRYAFRIDGHAWDAPKGVAAVNDGYGGRSAWLSVREPERKP